MRGAPLLAPGSLRAADPVATRRPASAPSGASTPTRLGFWRASRSFCLATGPAINRYKNQPAEAIAVLFQACAAVGITIEADAEVLRACRDYSSGGATPDHDAADALVALCTAILYREGECRAAIGGFPADHRIEGAIWVPRPGLLCQ